MGDSRVVAGTDGWMNLSVVSVSQETSRIRSYVLTRPDGGMLEPFTPGSHVDVRIPGGFVRQYSLCGEPGGAASWRIAVLREAAGLGGSAAMHELVAVGDVLPVARPRNLFPLAEHPGHTLFVAGGIGITPMIPMMIALRTKGAPFELHYCARSPQEAAFRQELSSRFGDENLFFHYDGGNPADSLDIGALLRAMPAQTHLYYCGPPGLMTTIARAAAAWDPHRVHCEHFKPRSMAVEDPGAFKIILARSGKEYWVPRDRSIVDVLRSHGITVDTMCENGICGHCRTRYLSGDPEHNDVVLDEAERGAFVMVCCARARSRELVLDL